MPGKYSTASADPIRTSEARGPYTPEAVLVLLRHGQTDLNLHRLLQGASDYPLNATGRQQSRQAGEFVRRHYEIDKVISSPRRRALETLEEAGFGGALVDGRLTEIDYGCLEGEPVDTASRQLMEMWEADPCLAPTGGESLETLYCRVASACEEMLGNSAGQTVLASTHATAVKAAVVWALGGEVSGILRMFLRPASVSVIASVPSGKVVLAVNERACL